jgi:hypothetical protein
MVKRIFLTTSLVVSSLFTAYTQQGGKTMYPFMELPNSARIGALGGNQVGLADGDLNLWYHNPATMGVADKGQAVLNYMNFVSDINVGYAAYAHDLKNIGRLAIGIHHIGYGTFKMTDEYDQEQGTFTASEQAILLGFSRQMSPNFALGITVKPIFSNFEAYRSFAIATDFGGTYTSTHKLFSAGLVIKNLGAQLSNYNGENEELFTDVQLGLSQKLEHAPFRFSLTFQGLTEWDLEYTTDDSQNGSAYDTEEDASLSFGNNLMRHTVLGVEFLPSKTFFVNLGYNHRRRQELKIEEKPGTVGYSWGFGLNLSKFRFSYGSARYHLGGPSNHFSLAINLGAFGS